MLNSTPSETFHLEFFASPAANASGYGEGKTYLGDTSVTTDASGNASFSLTVPAGDLVGQVLSATATDPGDNTSEFSKDIPIQSETSLSVGSSLSPSTYGQSVTFTATVAATGSGAEPDRHGDLRRRLDHARHRNAEHQQRRHHGDVDHGRLERRRRPRNHGGLFGRSELRGQHFGRFWLTFNTTISYLCVTTRISGAACNHHQWFADCGLFACPISQRQAKVVNLNGRR